MSNLPRHIKPRIIDALKVSPIVFLNGARLTVKNNIVQGISEQVMAKKLANL